MAKINIKTLEKNDFYNYLKQRLIKFGKEERLIQKSVFQMKEQI